MRVRSIGLALSLLALVSGCREAAPSARDAAPAPSSAIAPPPPARSLTAVPARSPGLRDGELGALITSISEKGGKFPSDNFVSNEPSYLHVASALDDPKLHGGAFLGVGPEQSFTYLAILEPQIAYLADIRRANVMLHLVYKLAFEEARSRADFLARLTSRHTGDLREDVTLDDLATWWSRVKSELADEKGTTTRVFERAKALGLSLDNDDDAAVRRAVHAFATEGLDVRYSMEGSARRYPSLLDLARINDDDGKPRHFLASEKSFRAVQRMERENRIVPIVADLAGPDGLRRVAADATARGLSMHVLYASNVEQYLFTPKTTWDAWLANVKAMPWADDGQILRVYFDQGKRHPDQHEGERTTTMLRSEKAFLAHATEHPFASWWDVATTRP